MLMRNMLLAGAMLAVTVFGFSLVGSSIEVLADPAKRRQMLSDVRERGERRRRPREAA